MSVLYVLARESRFVDIDRDALARRWTVRDWTGRDTVSPLATLRAVRGAEAVVAWFAGWHAVLPVTLAWLLRRPSVVITGGYDVADVPEAGYGMQRGGPGRWASRWVLRRATRLVANSHAGAEEARRAAPRAVIDVVHHGVPDLTGDVAAGPREGALTVGVVDRRNLERKGLRAFALTAQELPGVPFVLAGRIEDEDAARELPAPPNLEMTGWIDDDELARRYAAASVYVQASRHEGFGMAVAEAMLAGCVPVVTRAGALPEVVGDAGIVVESQDPAVLAQAIARALAAGAEPRRRARRRVLERFTLQSREEGLHAALDAALARRSRRAAA